MAATTFQGELEEGIASQIAGQSYSPFQGIVIQTAPIYKPELGVLYHGTAKVPFISISSTLAEIYPNQRPGTALIGDVRRIVTVAFVANVTSVEADTPDAYRLIRQQTMRRLNMSRFRGAFATDATCCILSGFVRPKSQVDVAAWVGSGKYVGAFDVVFDCREKTL